jgi:hypothetical protein
VWGVPSTLGAIQTPELQTTQKVTIHGSPFLSPWATWW